MKQVTLTLLLTVIFISLPYQTDCQQAMPEVLQTGTMNEQLDFIQQRTQIYNNFRAIREDMFLRIKNNALDSLEDAKMKIRDLALVIDKNNRDIDSLSAILLDVREELSAAIRNRDNIGFIGIPMHKAGYNMIVWSVIAGLSALLVFGFLLYKRNLFVTIRNREEINELREEFENYKKNSRELREKLVIEHFNELKRFKEGQGI